MIDESTMFARILIPVFFVGVAKFQIPARVSCAAITSATVIHEIHGRLSTGTERTVEISGMSGSCLFFLCDCIVSFSVCYINFGGKSVD